MKEYLTTVLKLVGALFLTSAILSIVSIDYRVSTLETSDGEQF